MKNILMRNGAILFLGTSLNMICMLLMQVILARNLELTEYGAVISALNLVNFLALFVSLGASEYILKSFGKYGAGAYKIVQTWIKLLLFSVVFLIIFVMVIFISDLFGKLTGTFLLIIIPNIILQGVLPLTLCIYQIEGNYKKVVLLNLILYSTRLLSSFVALFSNEGGIYFIGISLSALSVASIIYFLLHLKRYFSMDINIPKGQYVEFNNNAGLIKSTLKGVAPYALLALFYYGFYQSNILFINILLDENSVGLYNAAFTIISLTFIFPTIVLTQLFNPKLHFWIENDVQKVIVVFLQGSKWMALFGIFISIVLFFISDYIIQILFGTNFLEASLILVPLLIVIPLRYLQAVSDAIMNTENQIYIKNIIFFIVFIISITLNSILIPKMGLLGVILTTIISEFILLIFTFGFCWRFIKLKMSIRKKLNEGK